MVRLKGRFWFLLLILGLYLSCPGYSAVKSINIKNLPANQDMDEFSQEYGDGEKVLGALECADCSDDLNETAKCNKCVGMEEACPDCCLNDGLKAIRCSEGDTSADYDCSVAPFGNAEDCGLVECDDDDAKGDYQDCMSKCTSGSGCKAKGTGGAPKTSAAYGLQRRGCPLKDSDDLAPNDDSCIEVSGKNGLGRIWKCPSDGLKPKFADNYLDKSQCLPDSGLTFTHSKPNSTWGYGDYYAVTKVSPSCPSDSCTNSCSSRCEVVVSSPSCCAYGRCGGEAGRCSPPSCTPECPDKVCNYICVSGTACIVADSSTKDCVCSARGSCNPSSCTPKCSSSDACNRRSKSCTGDKCWSDCAPDSDDYYVYVLSDKYKNYINECIDKADTYEECADRVHCCQEGACPEETDSEGDCSPGFDLNCDLDSCENRLCDEYVDMCKNYTSATKIKSCAQIASDANSCLVDNTDCFREIDPDFKYDFVYRGGESLTVIWQIINKPVARDVSGVNFYTLVKIFNKDEDKTEPAAHTSMMNVKSLEAAFSIYGTTSISKGELEAGKSYRARVYYFLPEAEFCKPECETCASGTIEVELSHMSLILLRVRE